MRNVLELLQPGSGPSTPTRVRLAGLLSIVAGGALFVLGILLIGIFRRMAPAVFVAPMILGLALVPKGALQLLTGRRWVDNPRWVRIVALVLGVPGFIAALAYVLYLIQVR